MTEMKKVEEKLHFMSYHPVHVRDITTISHRDLNIVIPRDSLWPFPRARNMFETTEFN